MKKLALLGASFALLAAPALAQTSTSPSNPTTSSSPSMNSPSTAPSQMNQSATPSRSDSTSSSQTVGSAPSNVKFTSVSNNTMFSSKLRGLNVYNSQNESIGEISDIAFNKSNEVDALILSIGGFLGIGERYVAVEPSSVAVNFDSNNNTWRATMNTTKDQLQSAPEFKYPENDASRSTTNTSGNNPKK